MIDNLKSELPFSVKKGKTINPGLAQNESYKSSSMGKKHSLQKWIYMFHIFF